MLREVAQRWIDGLWQGAECEHGVLAELHDPAFVDHSSAGRGSDNAAFGAMLEGFFRAFPDFRTTIEDLVVDESAGKVAIRWSATATHRGPYLGVPASGREVAFRGIEILAIRDGRVTDRWGEWDGMDLLRQLGLWRPTADL